MTTVSPADRDRAQRRVRTLTTAAATVAGVLTLGGAAAAAGTFAGRTVSTPDASAAQGAAAQPTLDPNAAFQQPVQVPGGNASPYQGGGTYAGGGVPSGGS